MDDLPWSSFGKGPNHFQVEVMTVFTGRVGCPRRTSTSVRDSTHRLQTMTATELSPACMGQRIAVALCSEDEGFATKLNNER
jgi:hypothetical protein